jgi:hypothetical protein
MQFDGIGTPEYSIILFDNSYAEYASIKNGKIGAYKPITENFFKTISVYSKENNNLYGKMPSCVIGYASNGHKYKIVFKTKKRIQKIVFKSKTIKIEFPELVWFYELNGGLDLYIKEKNQLIPFSFSNITNSDVCIGTSPHPTSLKFTEAIEEIQSMLFDGTFTHEDKDVIEENINKIDLWKTVSKFTTI